MRYMCPKCGSEHIQKCEIIYMNGTVSHSSTTTMGKYEAETTGQASTSLAQEVSPPVEADTHYLAVFILGIIAYFLFTDGNMILGLIFGGLALLSAKVSADADDYNKNVFPKEYKAWQDSYFCFRCGNKFQI